MIPVVLGIKPGPSKGHSAVLIDEDRILVVKGDSASDACFWFLEVWCFLVVKRYKNETLDLSLW